jgi:hypothetical protein
MSLLVILTASSARGAAPTRNCLMAPLKRKKNSVFSYGSGVAAATVADYGDVVLAEYTQPFNEGDVTYYRPLYQKTVVSLNHFPLYTTGDAAFDAWYVYE